MRFGGEEGLPCWALAWEVTAFLCLRRLRSACAAPCAGLAPTSWLPFPEIRGLVTDPGVSLRPLCLSRSLEQMSAFCTAQRFAVPRLAVPLKVLEFGKSSDLG